jgi:hypothetical protein
MQNIITGISTTADTVHQMNNTGMTEHVEIATVVLVGVISFLVSIFKIYKGIDKRIDERIDARIKPSLEVLQETVTVVKSLEHTVAEMNATLNILKEILLMTKGGTK